MVGDIFWVGLPHTDLTAGVPRPALVVADVGMRDWVLCRITSRGRGRRGNVLITAQDMQTGRLPRDSWARPGRLFTLNETVLGPMLGRLDAAKLNEVLAVIRSLFPSR